MAVAVHTCVQCCRGHTRVAGAPRPPELTCKLQDSAHAHMHTYTHTCAHTNHYCLLPSGEGLPYHPLQLPFSNLRFFGDFTLPKPNPSFSHCHSRSPGKAKRMSGTPSSQQEVVPLLCPVGVSEMGFASLPTRSFSE